MQTMKYRHPTRQIPRSPVVSPAAFRSFDEIVLWWSYAIVYRGGQHVREGMQ
jgi:hypothetical protein